MEFEIVDLIDAYRSGELVPTDVIREAYRRMADRPEPPVWIHLIPEAESLARAEGLGAFDEKRPLYGIPLCRERQHRLGRDSDDSRVPGICVYAREICDCGGTINGGGGDPVG